MKTLKNTSAVTSKTTAPSNSFQVTPSVDQVKLLNRIAVKVGCTVPELVLGLAMGLVDATTDRISPYPAELVEQFAIRAKKPRLASGWKARRFVKVARLDRAA